MFEPTPGRCETDDLNHLCPHPRADHNHNHLIHAGVLIPTPWFVSPLVKLYMWNNHRGGGPVNVRSP